MKYLSLAVACFTFMIAPLQASQADLDPAARRAAHVEKAMNELFPAQVAQKPAWLKAKILALEEENLTAYGGKAFLPFQRTALTYFKTLDVKALSALAVELREVSGQGEPMGEEDRKEKIASKADKKIKKFFGKKGSKYINTAALASTVADVAAPLDRDLSWQVSVRLFEEAIEVCALNDQSIFEYCQQKAEGSHRKTSNYLNRFAARIVAVGEGYVKTLMDAYDRENAAAANNNNN